MARLIAAEIEDGACLQIGIGGMPNAVCSLLKDAGVSDLGIHTEMMVDGMIELYEAGLVTGARKQINRGQIVFTFAARLARSSTTSSTATRARRASRSTTRTCPHNIMRNERVVSINNTTQIDLQGQAASRVERAPPHQRAPAASSSSCAAPTQSKRRQVVHLPLVHLRTGRQAREPHRARR